MAVQNEETQKLLDDLRQELRSITLSASTMTHENAAGTLTVIGFHCGTATSLLDQLEDAIKNTTEFPVLVSYDVGKAMMQSIYEDPLYSGNFDLDKIKNMYQDIRADQIANQIKDCYYMRNILDEDGVVKEWQIFLSELSDHPIRYGKSDSATIRGIMDGLGMVQARFTSKGELVELDQFKPKLRMFLYTHPKNLKDNPSDG